MQDAPPQKAELKYNIREGTIEEVVEIGNITLESMDPSTVREYKKHLRSGKEHSIFIAVHGGQLIGYSVAYKSKKTCFWLNFGIISDVRYEDVLERLAQVQEDWAIGHSYKKIKVIIRSRFRDKFKLLIDRRFNPIDVKEMKNSDDNYVTLEKRL